MYEYVDHRSDVKLRARAGDLPALFADVGRGVSGLIARDIDDVMPVERVHLELHSDSLEHLMFDWVTEVLWTFRTRHMVLSTFEVTADGTDLRAMGRGETVDRHDHRARREVRGVSVEGLTVWRDEEGWVAEVTLDVAGGERHLKREA